MMLAPFLLALFPLASADAEAGADGGPGLAVLAAKIVTCAEEGPEVIDRGVLLVKDGRVEAVGPARSTEVPEGYEVVDAGDHWIMPGQVGLHCHAAGPNIFQFNDLNDRVALANPGLRVWPVPIPGIGMMKRAAAGGVTTVLYIPGSSSNIGGQGILWKTGFDNFEDSVLRFPGSLKLAQWGNPEDWAMGVNMTFQNWNTRNTFKRGIAYAKRWEAFESGEGPEPEIDIQFEIFRHLRKGECAISTHTQMYQVVLMTITMVAGELNLPVFLDHSSVGGWLTGGLAEELGVPAICGPRSVDTPARGMINWARTGYEGFRGLAAGYQEEGATQIGFNTDSPIIPQEELQLQAGMGVRYGLDDSDLAAIRGLTIIPARAAKVGDLVGSLEPGKHADFLVIDGHPADPRNAVELTYIEGRRVYDAERDGRLW